jgi:hypothetical protein
MFYDNDQWFAGLDLISWLGVLFCLTSPYTVDEVLKEIFDLFASIYKTRD